MYTFQPLPTPTHDWLGAIIASVLIGSIIVILGLLAFFKEKEEYYSHDAAQLELARQKHNRKVILALLAIVTILSASFFALAGSTDVTPPKNEKVVGVLKKYMPSGYEYRSGKTTHYRNAIFGLYEVPEGEVIMELRPGMFSPERVILYKN